MAATRRLPSCALASENSGLVEVATEDARVGGVLVFWIRRADKPKHAGILTGYLKARPDPHLRGRRQCGRARPDDFWRKRICGDGAIPASSRRGPA